MEPREDGGNIVVTLATAVGLADVHIGGTRTQYAFAVPHGIGEAFTYAGRRYTGQLYFTRAAWAFAMQLRRIDDFEPDSAYRGRLITDLEQETSMPIWHGLATLVAVSIRDYVEGDPNILLAAEIAWARREARTLQDQITDRTRELRGLYERHTQLVRLTDPESNGVPKPPFDM